MWRVKGCPRCKGDMLVDQDSYGWYEWCLQCGYRHDLTRIIELRAGDRVRMNINNQIGPFPYPAK